MVTEGSPATERKSLDKMPEPGANFPMPSDSGWWFTVAAYAAAILAVAFAPELAGSGWYRILAAIVLTAGSFGLVWSIRWVLSRSHGLRARWRKGLDYDELYEIAAENGRNFEASQRLIRRMLSIMPSHTEISVSVLAGQVLLEFSKRGRRTLPQVGRVLHLIDLEGGLVLGTFEITLNDGQNCQASDRGDLDAIFRGYAQNTSAKFLPRNLALVVLPQQDDAND